MANHKFTINGRTFDVNVNSIDGNKASVTVNGTAYEVQMEKDNNEDNAPKPVRTVKAASKPAAVAAAKDATAEKSVNSPLPGVILEISVKEGQSVRRGQKLLVLEAMKMENEVQAEWDGKVKSILVQQGESVLEGAKLITME